LLLLQVCFIGKGDAQGLGYEADRPTLSDGRVKMAVDYREVMQELRAGHSRACWAQQKEFWRIVSGPML